jgi:hypothetical protein
LKEKLRAEDPTRKKGEKQKVGTLRFSVPTFDGVSTSRVYGGDAEMLQRHHHTF